MYFVGLNPKGGINVQQAGMPKPMGVCLDDQGTLTMTAGFQVLRFENVLEPDQRVNNQFDACDMPRAVYVTGSLDAHDVGIDCERKPELNRMPLLNL